MTADTPSPSDQTVGEAGDGSDELKRRLTDFLCQVPFPRFVESQGVVKIVADDLAAWLALFIREEIQPPPSAPEPSTGEVLAGLVEEMTALRTELYESGRDDHFYEAIGVGKARALVEATLFSITGPET